MTDMEALILLVLINYPVLQEEGHVLTKLLNIVAGDKEAWFTLERTYPQFIQTLGNSDSVKLAKQLLVTANSCGIAVEMRKKLASRSRKYEELLDIISDAALRHRIGKYLVTAVPIALSLGFLPEDMEDDRFTVFLEEGIRINIGIQDLIPEEKRLFQVKEQWQQLEGFSGTGMIFACAACFAYPALSGSGRLEEFDKLLAAVHRLMYLNENSRSLSGIVDQFLTDFWDYIRSHDDINAVDLTKDLTAIRKSDTCLFFRQDTVSITSTLFEKIMEPMRARAIPCNTVKQALKEANVLMTDEKSTYQVKIRFLGRGMQDSLRGYRFRVEALEQREKDKGVRLRSFLKGMS